MCFSIFSTRLECDFEGESGHLDPVHIFYPFRVVFSSFTLVSSVSLEFLSIFLEFVFDLAPSDRVHIFNSFRVCFCIFHTRFECVFFRGLFVATVDSVKEAVLSSVKELKKKNFLKPKITSSPPKTSGEDERDLER